MQQGCVADREETKMHHRLRNFLSGAGSIVVLLPAPSPSRFLDLLPKESIEDTLRADWFAVGNDIAGAMGRVSQEKEWAGRAEKNANVS